MRAGVFLGILLGALAAAATAAVPRLPVVLLYGFQPAPGFVPTRLWETFAERLSGRPIGEAQRRDVEDGHVLYKLAAADADHFDIYLSHYAGSAEPTIRSLRHYAARLAREIAWIRRDAGAAAVDLVGHSMGGLVARCYVEADDFAPLLGQPGFDDYGTAYGDDVRTLVTLATPHHGIESAGFGSWLGPLIAELAPESPLLQALNAPSPGGSALAPSVRYVSMAGQTCIGCGLLQDAQACRERCVRDGIAWTGSDLVVAMESAYLAGAENTACLGADHVAMHVNAIVADAVVAALRGEPVPAVLFADARLAPGAPTGEASALEGQP